MNPFAEKPIIQSNHKWFEGRILWAIPILIIIIRSDNFNGFETVRFILAVLVSVVFLAIPIKSCIIRYRMMRRVTVYKDRIEVKFPHHKEWNYKILVKNIDCYCLDVLELETDKDTEVKTLETIYLLSGRKLWMYIAESDCSNYDEMRAVLENNFGITQRNGILNLSYEEMDTVERGGYIELEDISDEELAELEEQRRTRIKKGVFKPQYKKGINLTKWKPVMIAAVIFCLFLMPIYVSKVSREEHVVSISMINKETKGQYFTIDFINVDHRGVMYSRMHQSTKKYSHTTTQWVFMVKDRKDLCVLVAVDNDDRDKYSENELRSNCHYALFQKHRYELHRDKKYVEPIIAHIKKEAPYLKISEDASVLTLQEGHPIYMNGYLLHKGVDLLYNTNQKEIGARLIVLAVSRNVDGAKEQLEQMYKDATQNGTYKEITADAFYNLSYAYSRYSEYDKAIEAIDKAISLCPEKANYYERRGEFFARLGKKDEAMKMWEKVISLDPDYRKTHDSTLEKNYLMNK